MSWLESMRDDLSFRIREATEADLSGLEWEGAYRQYRHLYQNSMKEAKKGRRILLVSEAEHKLIGQIFILLHTIPADPLKLSATGYLYSFRVRSEYRNLGIGTSLMRSAEKNLRRLAFRRVLIGVAKENRDARRLYERLGYKILADDPGEWSFIDDENSERFVNEPTYIMEKILT